MGYTSLVGIRCQKKVYEAISDIDGLVAPDRVYINEAYKEYTLIWEWVKWYDDLFDDIKAFMDLLNNICVNHSDEEGWMFNFIRYGEGTDTAYDDCEILQNGYVEFYTHLDFCLRKQDVPL